MCDGSTKPISQLQEGEYVLTRDEETGDLSCWPVVSPYSSPNRALINVELVDQNGDREVLETTFDHPFYVVGEGWVRVENLELGDIVPTTDGQATIVGLAWTGQRATVYNFGVEQTRSYFVGELGAWVHNCFEWKTLRGKSEKYFKVRKPQGWQTKSADRGLGWKWLDKNGNERFRYMRPDPKQRRGCGSEIYQRGFTAA